jgi:ABC-type branched-subunit amino acid transport system substrate-binding protein
MRARLTALLSALALLAAGCSLGNVSPAQCTADAQCAAAFGAGSTCDKSTGYCSASQGCQSGHDCRALQGGGACVDSACVSAAPKDPQCPLTYPEGLLDQPLVGDGAPLVIGSIFSLDEAHDQDLTKAIELAVMEINQAGLAGNRQLGVVFCDVGGPGNTATGDDRTKLDQHAIDYLAGTLGVPYIVGPLTSGDSVKLIAELLDKKLPTVIISPGATSPALTDATKRLDPSDPYPLFWRTCPSDELQGDVLATHVVGADATLKTATVIHVNDPYGSGLAHVFQAKFPPGIAAVHLVPYEATDPDDPTKLAALVATADGYHDDAVLIIAHDGAIVIKMLTAMEGKTIASKRFFFTDGVKDPDLLATTIPAEIKAILANAQGTAPASPEGQLFNILSQSLQTQMHISATYSFLAHSYDATYVGAFGVAYAMRGGSDKWDGRDVSAGMANLSAGTKVELSGADAWIKGSGLMVSDGTIDIEGTSGSLQFDAKKGEAPGRVEVWTITGGQYVTQAVY